MQLQNGQTLVFMGDSITDAGRNRPFATDWGFGDGYVSQVEALLTSVYPETLIRIINSGVSGDRVIELAARWQTDVLDFSPDWLSVMVGINDVWRQFDRATDPEQIDVQQFETTYRNLLQQTRPRLKGLVLMTPFYLEPNKDEPLRAQMDIYGGVVRRLADEFDANFVDVQAAFDRYMAIRPTQSLCADRVHPGPAGHMIIARAFLNAIGFDWSKLNT